MINIEPIRVDVEREEDRRICSPIGRNSVAVSFDPIVKCSSSDDLLAEAVELSWLPAGMLPFLRGLHDPFLDDLTAEVSFVEVLA